MNILAISIGSNSNDKEKQINNCLLWIKANFDFIAVSDIYNSPATNGKDPDYMNAVAIIKSEESHQNLVKNFKDYESSCGRTDDSKIKGEIPIDLDIVIWNDKIIRNKDYNQEYFKIGWKQINRKMNNLKISPIGIGILLVSIAYIVIKADCDTAWYGYIDDFFVFLSGYTFFMATRYQNSNLKRILLLISGTLFIIGMLSLIALILFS